MPPTPVQINMVSPDGRTTKLVPESEAGAHARGGWTFQTPAQETDTAYRAGRKERFGTGGLSSKLKTFKEGYLDAFTFGAIPTVQAKLGTEEDREEVQLNREENANTHLFGEGVGVLAQQFVPIPGLGEVGAARTAVTAGRLAKGAEGAVEVSRAARLAQAARGVGRSAALGAAEGAAQAGGQYLSESAIYDKPATARGFLGSAVSGALWGGAAGGVFGVGEGTFTAAKRLWPEAEVTREAATKTARKASSEIGAAVRDSETLEQAARAKVRRVGRAAVDTDPAAAAHLETLQQEARAQAAAKTRDLEARASASASRAQTAASNAESAAARAERVKAGPKAKGVKAVQAAEVPPIDLLPAEEWAATAGKPPVPDAGIDLGRSPPPATGEPVHPLGAYDSETRRAYDAKEALKGKIGDAIYGGNDAPSQRVFLGPLRREMGLSREEFEAWVKGAQTRGEVELSRIDRAGDLSPDRLADMQAEAFKGPASLGTTGDRHVLRFIEPKTAPEAAATAAPLRGRVGRVGQPRPALDLQVALEETSGRLRGGESFATLSEEGKALDAIARKADPEMAALEDLATAHAAARSDVKRYVALLGERADTLADRGIAAGTLRRDDDILRRIEGGSDILSAATAPRGRGPVGSLVGEEGRAEITRLRNPYRDEELIAKAEANPTFLDEGDIVHGAPARTSARADLADRILTGKTDPTRLSIEALVPREITDEATGEIRQALGREARPATSDEIMGAIERQRRDPRFKSHLDDGAMTGLRQRLGLGYSDEELGALAARSPTAREALAPLDDSLEGGIARALRSKTAEAGYSTSELAALAAGSPTARRALAGLPDTATLDDHILHALRGRIDDEDQHLVKAIDALSRFEQTGAELAHRLGPDLTPPGSWRRAQDHMAAVADHSDRKSLTATLHADDIARNGVPPEEMATRWGRRITPEDLADATGDETGTAGARAKGLVGHLADAGAALEVLSSFNVPGLPRPHDVPFIGPLLSLYLKGRAAVKVWKRMGGKVPTTVETKMAERAVEVRNRVRRAARSALDTGAKASRAAARVAPQAGVVLARPLFNGDETGARRPKAGTPGEIWAERSNEIAAALQPGAIERSLRHRVPTSDPQLAQEMVDGLRAQVTYLADKMPRKPPGIGTRSNPWHPPPAETAKFARIVDALHEPAATLEAASAGAVDIDGMDAVRTVYPQLYAEWHTEMVATLLDDAENIPYQRRVQLGLLGVKLDPTQLPGFASRMQAGYDEPAQPPGPQPPGPPTPSIAGPVNLAQNISLPEDRR